MIIIEEMTIIGMAQNLEVRDFWYYHLRGVVLAWISLEECWAPHYLGMYYSSSMMKPVLRPSYIGAMLGTLL